MKHLLILLLVGTGCASIPGLRVARSLSDKNLASKPAQLQLTAPRDAADSYAIDLGLGYARTIITDTTSQSDLVVGGEYHRNTLADKPQNTMVITIGLDQQRGQLDTAPIVWYPGIATKYKDDQIKHTQSLLPTLSVTLASKPYYIGRVIGQHQSVAWAWQPTAAAEWEQIYHAAQNPTGHIGRVSAAADVGIYPFWRAMKSRIEFSVTGRAWQDLMRTSALGGSKRHRLLKISLSYFLDADRHFSIGIDRVSGENPSEGQPDQHYTQLSFRVGLP